MSNDRVPMTPAGEAALRAELNQLKKVERPEIIKAIADARDHGDLKENAEYHAARERQGMIESRVKDIEGKLSHAQVIDVTKISANGMVIFGATVTLMDIKTEEEITYQIVGQDEANVERFWRWWWNARHGRYGPQGISQTGQTVQRMRLPQRSFY